MHRTRYKILVKKKTPLWFETEDITEFLAKILEYHKDGYKLDEASELAHLTDPYQRQIVVVFLG